MSLTNPTDTAQQLPNAQQHLRTQKDVTSQFYIRGSFVGTTLITLYLHIEMAVTEHDFGSKISVELLATMLALFLLALLVGYIIGIVPAFVTGAAFYRLLSGRTAEQFNPATRTILLGALAGMIWVLLALICDFVFTTDFWFTLIVAAVVLPTSMICAFYERRFIEYS